MKSTPLVLALISALLPALAPAQDASPASVPAGGPDMTLAPVFNLWSGTPPGDKGGIPAESSKPTTLGALLPTQTINVSIPNMTVFAPERGTANGVSVIVCPGGGFHELEMEKEGERPARWLSNLGVTAFVLKYRVPDREGESEHLAAIQDIQRAIRIVRSNAQAWKLDPDKIGVMGFSAGAALGVYAATGYDQATYPAADAADNVSCRPDFGAIIYPGGLLERGTDRLSDMVKVTKDTPPLFIVDAEFDRVNSDNSTLLFLAMKHAGAQAELHMYTAGVHGFALRPGPNPHTTWPDRLRDWMVSEGFMKYGIAQAAQSDVTPQPAPPAAAPAPAAN